MIYECRTVHLIQNEKSKLDLGPRLEANFDKIKYKIRLIRLIIKIDSTFCKWLFTVGTSFLSELFIKLL